MEYENRLQVLVNDKTLKKINQKRGHLATSIYLRMLIEEALK